MLINLLIEFISLAARVLSLAVLAHVILGYFLPAHHTLRVRLAQLIEPLLAPIRGRLPSVQTIDFSPLVLFILIQIAEYILVSLLLTLR
ncbi:MAG: YggT family protein [Anaerolineaceae bacterium]|nr:YggT family protein [Anaerolineaceae bacterium]